MSFARLASIALGAILVNNVIFSRLLGVRPLPDAFRKLDTAAALGLSVTFAMGLASAASWLVDRYLLVKFGLTYLRTAAFVLVILLLMLLLGGVTRRYLPALHAALGDFLPTVTANCAVLGAVLLNIRNGYGFGESVVFGFAGGLGFLLAMVLLAGVRERLTFADPPACFRGFPLALVAAGLMALAFQGFSGLRIW